jgi:hypothetical protein
LILQADQVLATHTLTWPRGVSISAAARKFSALREREFSRTLKPMEVHFNPDVQAKLDKLAIQRGRASGKLVEDVVAG